MESCEGGVAPRMGPAGLKRATVFPGPDRIIETYGRDLQRNPTVVIRRRDLRSKSSV